MTTRQPRDAMGEGKQDAEEEPCWYRFDCAHEEVQCRGLCSPVTHSVPRSVMHCAAWPAMIARYC